MLIRNRARRRVIDMVGEGLLIFLGITAAIWFENSNDGRRERALETEIMQEMLADLRTDTTDLNLNLNGLTYVKAGLDTVVAALEPGRGWEASLAPYFGAAYGTLIFVDSRAAYQHLTTAGLDVIQDADLRFRITTYYEYRMSTIAIVEGRFVAAVRDQVLGPHMREKFTFETPPTSIPAGYLMAPATPVDFAALKDDLAFRNAIREYQGGVGLDIEVTRGHIATAETLIADIEAALAAR